MQGVLKEALQKLNIMTEVFFSRLVTSETLAIKTPQIELFLKRAAATDLKGLVVEGGYTKFKLPDSFPKFGEGNINIKV